MNTSLTRWGCGDTGIGPSSERQQTAQSDSLRCDLVAAADLQVPPGSDPRGRGRGQPYRLQVLWPSAWLPLHRGPCIADAELDDALCPWCIADGTATERFNAIFVDVGWGIPPGVSPSVLKTLSERTPSFTAWQQEHWLYHCDDAAAYLGRADYFRLSQHADALYMVLHENDEYGWTEDASREWVASMSMDESPTAYLFRCLHCRTDLAYADMD